MRRALTSAGSPPPWKRPPLVRRRPGHAGTGIVGAVSKLPLRVSGIVFDCDGLLLDTEACWSRAETALFARYGHSFGPAEKDLLIGRAIPSACERMADCLGMAGEGPRLQAELAPLVEAELAAGTRPLPGAEALLAALAGRVPLAVATNSPRRMLDNALRSAGLTDYFAFTVAADEVRDPKPAPDLYLAAFAALGASPREGVTLEDSATGAAAARASGAYLVAVPSQPDKRLDGDYNTASLADPVLQDWAARVEAGAAEPR